MNDIMEVEIMLPRDHWPKGSLGKGDMKTIINGPELVSTDVKPVPTDHPDRGSIPRRSIGGTAMPPFD